MIELRVAARNRRRVVADLLADRLLGAMQIVLDFLPQRLQERKVPFLFGRSWRRCCWHDCLSAEILLRFYMSSAMVLPRDVPPGSAPNSASASSNAARKPGRHASHPHLLGCGTPITTQESNASVTLNAPTKPFTGW